MGKVRTPRYRTCCVPALGQALDNTVVTVFHNNPREDIILIPTLQIRILRLRERGPTCPRSKNKQVLEPYGATGPTDKVPYELKCSGVSRPQAVKVTNSGSKQLSAQSLSPINEGGGQRGKVAC